MAFEIPGHSQFSQGSREIFLRGIALLIEANDTLLMGRQGKPELHIKLKQLATVIDVMNDGKGPDLLGVCEAESSSVLLDLVKTLNQPNRNYAVVHADNGDMRGIDVAFIYDRDLFDI